MQNIVFIMQDILFCRVDAVSLLTYKFDKKSILEEKFCRLLPFATLDWNGI